MREPGGAGGGSRNFLAALCDAAGWGLGMGLISHNTILPLLVQQLGGGAVAVGLIPALMYGGWLLPGVFIARWGDSLPVVKHAVVLVGLAERLLILLAGAACFLLGAERPGLLLMLFFIFWGGTNFLMGINTPLYFRLIARTIPARQRGLLYGIGGAVSGVGGLLGAPAAGFLLERYPFPEGFGYCFVMAFGILLITLLPLTAMHEPRPAATSPQPARREVEWRRLRALMLSDRRLLMLCAVVALFSVHQMVGPFFAFYALREWSAGPAFIAELTQAAFAARIVGYLAAGWLADRSGNKLVLVLSALCAVMAVALPLAIPGLALLPLAIGINEIASLGFAVCAQNYVLELCEPDAAASYTALYNLLTGPFRVALPLVGGLIVGFAGFQWLFATALAGAAMAAALVIVRLPEPRSLATAAP